MHGFEKYATALEFNKVIEDISLKCVSETGRSRLKSSLPLHDPEILRTILAEISEMRNIYLTEGGFPIWDFLDVRVLFNKMEPQESYLEISEFVQLQNFLELIEEITKFAQKHNEKYPTLSPLFRKLELTDKLLNQMRFTFESSDRIFDNASNELKAIRKEMSRLDSEIHIRLERIMRKDTDHIQEEYMTLRDGRLVLPVREFSLNKVPGIVHGQSGSGATYFVEPMSVVQLNNEMQKVVVAERKEIIKILKRLTGLVRESQPVLASNFELLNRLDVIQAKAREANQFKAVAPEIATDFKLHLINARHPALLRILPESTVPLSVEAGGDFNELVISGPNAGGKTVALKTIGLMQLLFQSGFHVPVAEGTSMPICKQIFAVIGDDQSIENDLSTFSSHLNALQDILENIEPQSLVLIDEIGNGTEPGGGAALAISILEQLNQDEIVTIATTHQNQLKYYASESDHVQNAAMQFDNEHLKPVFTLEMGIPGSSYTFEICRRMGLDEDVIRRAAEISGKDSFKLDKLLTDVSESAQKYTEKRNQLSIKESELGSLITLYKTKSESLNKDRKKLTKEAKVQARALLENVNREIEKVIRDIKESGADKQVVKKSRSRLQELRGSLDTNVKPQAKNEYSFKDIKKGQRARSLQYGVSGVVSKVFVSKREVEIEKDGLKITVGADDLELLKTDGDVIPFLTNSANESHSTNVANEIDLRGLTSEEAISEVERYIDNAVLSNWTEVRIVHGKGTGALRKAIQQYLGSLKSIKNFRMGKWGEGDSGVTVVEL